MIPMMVENQVRQLAVAYIASAQHTSRPNNLGKLTTIHQEALASNAKPQRAPCTLITRNIRANHAISYIPTSRHLFSITHRNEQRMAVLYNCEFLVEAGPADACSVDIDLAVGRAAAEEDLWGSRDFFAECRDELGCWRWVWMLLVPRLWSETWRI